MFSLIKNISKHTAIYSLGDLLGKGLAFLMIPLYTHYLAAAEYGTLELLELSTYIAGLLMAMGIAQSVVRFYHEYEEQDEKDRVISVAMISVWGISAVVLPILIIFSEEISLFVLDSTEFSKLFILVFISMTINLSNEIPMTLLRIKEKSSLYMAISLARMVIMLSLNILFIVYYGMGVMGILISSLVGSSLSGLFLTIYTLKNIKVSFTFDQLKQLVTYSFPLVWVWLGMFTINFGDRFIIQRFMDLDAVGVYSLAYKFGVMGNILVLSPFILTWAPKRFEIVNEPNAKETYAVVFTYFIFALVFVSLGISMMIKDVIFILADQEYHAAGRYVPLILASYLFYAVYQYVQFGLLLKKKTKILGTATLLVAGANILLNLLLIPLLGIWGAALATLLSFVLLALSIFPSSQKFYYVPYEYGRLTKVVLVAVAMFFLGDLLTTGSIWLNIVLKFMIALTFPLVLFLTRFYTEAEISKGRELVGQLLAKIKSLLKTGK